MKKLNKLKLMTSFVTAAGLGIAALETGLPFAVACMGVITTGAITYAGYDTVLLPALDSGLNDKKIIKQARKANKKAKRINNAPTPITPFKRVAGKNLGKSSIISHVKQPKLY
ncbi:MAG: hypothetical protein GY793_02895 [Proteobacteria bacterium]|nr:hypothetical protein [Pseudomonadota bacterium]